MLGEVLVGRLDATDLRLGRQDDRVEVAADAPGTYVVELRSARGTTAYPLTWAPDLDDLVDARAEELLAGPTSPAGTVRLDGAAAALVVQDALERRTVGPPDEVGDALDKLFRLGLAWRDPQGHLHASPLPKALKALDHSWDSTFRY